MTLAKFVIIITISLTAIAVALIVGAVFLMEKEQKQGGVVKSKPMRDESEWVYPLMRSKVIYWVPIEERLPDEFETVLFTLEWDDTGRLEVCADTYHQMSLWVQGSIVAWAELPEPYKK